MMRLEIRSTDRVGIAQEILTIFAHKNWNIRALEVEANVSYVRLRGDQIEFSHVVASLMAISGVSACRQIDLLPSERKADHLVTILEQISDPVIDIDDQGNIMTLNRSAEIVLGKSKQALVNQSFYKLAKFTADKKTIVRRQSVELTIGNCSYIADISPVINKQQIAGAVIVLTSMLSIGQQVAMVQQRDDYTEGNIIGDSEQIKLLVEQAEKFASLDLPVCITGETGTGKELFARSLHANSSRANAPFLAVNCAALPEHLLESELFGYAPGAFTDAQKGGKPGLIELANGGTLFLDEIAEMSVYLQAKLLRFLQDLKYRRVGGTTEKTADVRIISATHQQLPKLVEEQEFRQDLYYRLNVLTLDVPPLRQRISDIKPLCTFFLTRAAQQTNKPEPKITEMAFNLMANYHWPGNIRELQNVLFRLVALATTPVIDEQVIAAAMSSNQKQSNETNDEEALTQVESWASAQAQFESKLLAALYPSYPSTRALAKRLGISHNTIAMKLKKYQIV